MTNKERQRFETAYQGWKAQPVERSNASNPLWRYSQDGVNAQAMLAETIEAFHERGHIQPAPFGEARWYDAVTTLARDIRALGHQLQLGRQQIAVREQLQRTERLKEVWTAYRQVTGR